MPHIVGPVFPWPIISDPSDRDFLGNAARAQSLILDSRDLDALRIKNARGTNESGNTLLRSGIFHVDKHGANR